MFVYRQSILAVVVIAIAGFTVACSSGGSSNTTEQNEGGGATAGNTAGETIDGGTATGDTTTGGTTAGGTTTGQTENNASLPNILLVIADDQGLDSSAQYSLSADVPNTPVINNLAQSGITFENAWATPSCTTTRASMLTGKHGINNGVTFTPGVLSPDVGSIHRYLQDASSDYQTAVFGKWHVAGGNPDSNHPATIGVEHYVGNLAGNLTDYSDWDVTINGVTERNTDYHTSALVDYAIEWIDEQESPWFTWLAFSAPHSPFHSPPEAFNTRNLSGTAVDIEANKRDYYLSALETLDTELGRLLASLDPEERENTLVIYIGDNGTPRTVIDRNAYIGSHGKGTLFEGGVQVPLVISGAGVTRTNVRESGLVSIVDFFPTIAALAGNDNETMHDGYNLLPSFTNTDAITRQYLYTEFVSDDQLGSGWTVRSATHKYIAYSDSTEAFYDLEADPGESTNLISSVATSLLNPLKEFGLTTRNESDNSTAVLDITDSLLQNDNPNCADHAKSYASSVADANSGESFTGLLDVSSTSTQCIFSSNAIPNHTFNDGSQAFPNVVSEQTVEYRIPIVPTVATVTTPLSLQYDNAILLNGVKVDLLAAGCFGVGNGKVGCNDNSQPWRYDPMHEKNGFRVDTHNAHSQPDGTYHYHGDPIALFDRSGAVASPLVGFAADGFPIYGSFVTEGGVIRKIRSSFQLKPGDRPVEEGSPGGAYDGSFRDDYEFIEGSGDLDQCNGRMVDNQYRYYITDAYPYLMSCFRGSVDQSFRK